MKSEKHHPRALAHVRSATALIVGLAAALAWATPAFAVVRSVSLAPPAQTYSGPCPGTVRFTATIVADAGDTVQYQFHGSSVPDYAPYTGSTTIPSPGPTPVVEDLTVTSSLQGTFTRQIHAATSAGFRSGMDSNTVSFTVACGSSSGGGNRHTRQRNGGSNSGFVLFGGPTNLTRTSDPQVCGQHGGFAGLLCGDALHNGDLILIWNWAGSFPNGYRIYETDGGQRKHVVDQTNGQLTLEILTPPAGGFAGKCYVVNAYRGAAATRDSNQFCVGSTYLPTSMLKLSPQQTASRSKRYDYTAPFGIPDCCVIPSSGGVNFGFLHGLEGSGPTLDHHNWVFRGYLLFDPSQIAGKRVFRAILTTNLAFQEVQCFGAIGPATSAWVGNSDFADADFSYNITPSVSGQQAQFDVTPIVRAWAAGSPNFGFAIRGTNEDTGAEDTSSCMTGLPNPMLMIERY